MYKVWHREHDGWWYVTIRQSGKRQQIKLLKGPDDGPTKKLAEQQMIQELAQLKVAEDIPDAPRWITVGHVIRAYLKHSEEENDHETYVWHCYFLNPPFNKSGKQKLGFLQACGKLRLTEIRKRHVRAWLKKRGYNPTSQNRAIGVVKRAFNWAVEEEHIPRNPLAHLRKPKALRRERILEPEERTLIIKSIKDAAFAEYFFALSESGCRPGEVARVRVEDVSLEHGVWIFGKHKTLKQTGRQRVVYLTPILRDLTKRLVEQRGTGHLFLNRRGKPWSKNAIRIRFRNLRKKFPQLKGVVAYTVRHSFATDALERGVPDADVAELMGHQGTAMVHEAYSKLYLKRDHLRDAAARAREDLRTPRADDIPPDTNGGMPPSPPLQ